MQNLTGAEAAPPTSSTTTTPPPSGKFFIEIFSGTGRLSDTIREMFPGIAAVEVDILEKGGERDLLKKSTFRWVMDLAQHPDCIGMWFGYPCGTFSSARRGGKKGPPPLRGHDAKTIWGFPWLEGTDEIRVGKANALLKRMHTIM